MGIFSDSAMEVEGYLGEVIIFAGNFVPQGYAFCEGQILPIDTDQALFAIIGATYGGDGRTTFALPDLREAERLLGGARYIIRIQGTFPRRE